MPKQPVSLPKEDELNVFEAAALVGMSPKLLQWLASYAPKQGIARKLKVRKEGQNVFVERAELVGFDDWLKLPWPSKDDARPPVPAGIKTEIREEAGGECAICHKNGNTCEAAHIDPIAKSKNNHPENLIWLCANHHTAFDHGGFGPSADAKHFVAAFKQSMIYFRRGVWELQAKVTGRLFTMLKACDSLNDQLSAAKTTDQIAAIKALATKAVGEVKKMAPTSTSDPDYVAFVAMKPQFDILAVSSTEAKDVGATLKFASELKAEFARRAGYEPCPLCRGKGHYKHEDCPACGGEGELKAADIRNLDLDRYEDVACPLCNGTGKFDGDDCPACGGEGEMERRYADQVDTREWDEVTCNLCNGAGRWKHADCPVCQGSGMLQRHQRDQVDVRDYAPVDCPLCEGRGTFHGEDCPACRGERQMERRYAEQIDTRDYEGVSCFLCNGSGQWRGIQCPACAGEGRMERWRSDQMDRSDFKMVPCPECGGTDSDFCRSCDGEGEIPRYIAERW